MYVFFSPFDNHRDDSNARLFFSSKTFHHNSTQHKTGLWIEHQIDEGCKAIELNPIEY